MKPRNQRIKAKTTTNPAKKGRPVKSRKPYNRYHRGMTARG